MENRAIGLVISSFNYRRQSISIDGEMIVDVALFNVPNIIMPRCK